MIVYLKGTFIQKAPTHVIVDVNGIGYEAKISLYTFGQLKTWQSGQLLTHYYRKGDVYTLYGFVQPEEKQCFLALLNVNGIGPSTAMMVLSALSPEDLQATIAQQNITVLKSIKGIGNKAAQRIVLELKDKNITTADATTNQGPAQDQLHEAALTALIKLGLPKTTAEKTLYQVLKNAPTPPSLEDLIKQVLQG